ncbi:heme o synthase [Priestia koreensis]|uniref:heme o synthase n=1 Tax=Priestia koreensis TaxID=284581 RepID=UPI0009F87CAD|nr:heme o synthase [Priestia koreensis]
MQSNANIYTNVEDSPTAEKESWLSILSQTVKVGIIKSNLIPMLAGLTLALYTYHYSLLPKLPNIILAFIGSALVIGAACAYNNLYDRDIDAVMERTKNRPTVTGSIKPATVMWLAIIMTIVGLGALYFASPLSSLMGFLGMFFYVVPYTMWTKRRTIYNTEVGSISGAIPTLIGWTAIKPDLSHPAIWGLFFIMLIWQMPHFYAIALRKYDEYKAANVPMLPVVKGMKRTYLQTNIYLVLLIASSFLMAPLSWGLTIVALILGVIWLILSLRIYNKADTKKWAKTLFIFSLIHMTALFSTVIVYSLIGMFL